MRVIHKILTALLFAGLIASCNSRSNSDFTSPFDPNKSLTTGWEYNNEEYAGIEISPYEGQTAAPGLVFIEGGTFTMGRNSEDILNTWDNTPRRVSVSSFYMDQFEVTNAAWKEYMWWLSLVFKNTPSIINEAKPDTMVWARALSHNDKMINNYLRHPAYNDYPVVGVSWEQAQQYCLWRTDRVNEALLIDQGIIEATDYMAVKAMETQAEVLNTIFSTRKYLTATSYKPVTGAKPLLNVYGEEKKVTAADGILFPEYRLPTEAEWEYAAYGMTLAASDGAEFAEKRSYPWDGNDFRDLSIEGQGRMMANFAQGRGDYMGVAGDLNDGGDYTMPVWTYTGNDFGLYNMAGNVNEWVADVYRTSSSELVQGHNPYRGNVFQKQIMVDTIIDGESMRIAKLDKFGQPLLEDYSEETFAGRYPRSDLRNFKDGDPTSSYSDTDWNRELPVDEATARLYAADGDTPEGMLSPGLTNSVRVYKGGSFNDRAYYLNPATRRYLEQSRAKDDLGFRCAMDRVGSSISYK